MYNIINNQINPKILLILILTVLSVSCDIISEENRIVEMETVIPQKKVLLLDFTDQACPNCPKAAIEVANLTAAYGEDIVPVTIHGSAIPRPLVTADGNIYDVHFGAREAGHPAGVIDGKFVAVFEQWGGEVLKRFNISHFVNISITTDYNTENKEVKIVSRLSKQKNMANVKILIWLIEDHIIDRQIVGSETLPDYEHRHIFRAAVNGTWGEDLTFDTEEKTLEHRYTLNANWKTQDISIIVFVYNAQTDEVYDVNEIELKTKN